MLSRKKISHFLPLCLLASVATAFAQLQPVEPDPLARIRDAAKNNVQACSATGETLCEQVAPKIIANAQENSPLEENVRRLARQIHEMKIMSPAEAAEWSVAAFRAAGVEAHMEKNADPAAESSSAPRTHDAVVAEIRGREKPDEWVLLGASLAPRGLDTVDQACSVAMVIEAARDISLTGVHPRRSIRFVIFTEADRNMPASWSYVHAHRAELNRARAAISVDGGSGRMTGYILNGRRDIEAGLRETMKPIEPWNVENFALDTLFISPSFDFLLEGIPSIVANQEGMLVLRGIPDDSDALKNLDIPELRRSTAIVAVTAFGIAERAEPIGPRQSREEINALLKTTHLEEEMNVAGIRSQWESGQRGRTP